MASSVKKTTPAKRAMRTPEQINAQQRADAEKQFAAKLPAKTTSTAVAVSDGRTPQQAYLDEIAPASIVGRMAKFDIKGSVFVTPDDGEKIGDDVDLIALCDQTLVGRIKFNGEGNPPDRVMGLLYDGFIPPADSELPDRDESQWETGLDGKPTDPWQHQVYLVLQRPDTQELYTFITGSKTGRRAVGNLLRHYDRMERAKSGTYPVIRLKVGGFNHPDSRVGWVPTPVFSVVGRAQKDSAAIPDTSLRADMNDSLDHI
jgi:hypothetical protein